MLQVQQECKGSSCRQSNLKHNTLIHCQLTRPTGLVRKVPLETLLLKQLCRCLQNAKSRKFVRQSSSAYHLKISTWNLFDRASKMRAFSLLKNFSRFLPQAFTATILAPSWAHMLGIEVQ